MARRNPTNPDTPDWSLSVAQQTSVDLLVGSKTLSDTASALGVTRQTVSEWLNHHPDFQAELNRTDMSCGRAWLIASERYCPRL
jgi:hypothetical protein